MSFFGTKNVEDNCKCKTKQLSQSFERLHKDRINCKVFLNKEFYEGMVTQVFNDHVWFITKIEGASKHVIIPFVSITAIEII